MLYELRVYHPVPGRLPKLLARFEKLLPIWEGHGIRAVGFWTTAVGESSTDLTYILPWESLADRERRWSAFQADPGWIAARAATETPDKIVQSVRNEFWTPTAFSSVR